MAKPSGIVRRYWKNRPWITIVRLNHRVNSPLLDREEKELVYGRLGAVSRLGEVLHELKCQTVGSVWHFRAC